MNGSEPCKPTDVAVLVRPACGLAGGDRDLLAARKLRDLKIGPVGANHDVISVRSLSGREPGCCVPHIGPIDPGGRILATVAPQR